MSSITYTEAPRRSRRDVTPISEKEGEAIEARYSQSLHHPPVVPPTSKRYIHAQMLWKEFLQFRHYNGPCLQHGEPIPSPGRLKHFMEWVFKGSVGLLTERMTLKTLKNTWYSFRTMYFRTTDNLIPPHIGTDVLSFIKTELRGKGLAKVRRQKALADALDIGWLLTYLWCYDIHEFRHPRYRVQLSFMLLLITYTGARPGTIIESSAYRGSNQAMRYKDFELIGLPTGPGNSLELILKVRFRYEKGNRDQGGNDHEEYKWVALREDRICRGRCPVSHFLGLAFADDIFVDLRKPGELKYLKSLGNNEGLHFRFKKTKQDMLIFRHCKKDNSIDPELSYNYNEASRDVAELGIRLGFRETLRMYNLRRGTANAIDGNAEVSPNQYSQLLGHAVKVMGESYISNISAIDVQGIINHESLRQDHIRMLRSMRLNLNPNAPTSLPFLENKAVLEHPDLVQLDADLRILEGKRLAEGDSLQLRQQHNNTIWKRKRLFVKLYQKARIQYRDISFELADSNKIRKMIENGENGVLTDKTKTTSESPLLKFISPTHFPDRFAIAVGFWTQEPHHNALPDASIIQALQNLCMPEECVNYYPGKLQSMAAVQFRRNLRAKESKRLNDVRRKAGLNSQSGQAVQSRKSISTHLKRHLTKHQSQCLWDKCNLQCASEEDLQRHLWESHSVTLKQGPFEPKFCFEHPECGWFTDEFNWEDHCEIHAKAPRRNLNLVQSYHMFTAGLQCPFCLNTQSLFSKQFTQFTNRGIFNRHMDVHQKAYRDRGPMKCPVLSCTSDLFTSYFELQIHFFDIHGLKLKGFTRSHGLRHSKLDHVHVDDEIEEEREFREDFAELALDLENQSEDDANDWTDVSVSDDGLEDTIGREASASKLCGRIKRKVMLDISSCKHQKFKSQRSN
ncbi:hypothetical protein B0O99DRAFT_687011 [Bisporella sp. PMI_857]|nr:hypothetical protein B0O99DRAFT_687011 [Bisporella sp. PMI_857]